MVKDQVISVTDLRTKTKDCLQDLEKYPKYIFINNKMVAVLLDVDEYEALTQPDLIELPTVEVTDEVQNLALKAKKTPKEDLIDL